jgi:ribonuclease inhibitor
MVAPRSCESRAVHVYTIELDRITSREVLNAELARAFSFPDYYGRNWDSFDECIDDIEQPAAIEVLGFQGFRFRLPREAMLLAQCLRAAAERRPPGERAAIEQQLYGAAKRRPGSQAIRQANARCSSKIRAIATSAGSHRCRMKATGRFARIRIRGARKIHNHNSFAQRSQ